MSLQGDLSSLVYKQQLVWGCRGDKAGPDRMGSNRFVAQCLHSFLPGCVLEQSPELDMWSYPHTEHVLPVPRWWFSRRRHLTTSHSRSMKLRPLLQDALRMWCCPWCWKLPAGVYVCVCGQTVACHRITEQRWPAFTSLHVDLLLLTNTCLQVSHTDSKISRFSSQNI